MREIKDLTACFARIRVAQMSQQMLGVSGFGSAKKGAGGTGGGKVASFEYNAYRNALKEHVKSGWRWGGREQLKARVFIRMGPDGVVREVTLTSSSGNPRFDDSVLRAVYKASPLPRPSSKLYPSFREFPLIFTPD